MEQTNAYLDNDRLELVVKQGIFKKNLVIDSSGIEFKKKYVPFTDIQSLRYGATNVYINGMHSRVDYNFDFLLADGKTFTIFFSVIGFSKKSKEESKENYSAVIDVLWKHLTSKIVNQMAETLNRNGTVKVGNFEIERTGIRINYTRFFFSKREAFIPWKECMKGVGPGYFYIQSAVDKKIIAKSAFKKTWNLNAFYSLVNYLWENGNCFKLERGEKI